jgi:DNA repair exonuclease SbcCD ATPase subunit
MSMKRLEERVERMDYYIQRATEPINDLEKMLKKTQAKRQKDINTLLKAQSQIEELKKRKAKK